MIRIINDFFNEDELRSIQDFALTKAKYTPCFFNEATEKNKKTHYGNRFLLNTNNKLKNFLIKQSELKFKLKNLKIVDSSSIDQRNLDHFKPHVDSGNPEVKTNILIMIYGPTAVTNGTVFYTDGELDIHVGFKENRAVLFPSDWWHSPHASNVPNLRRYTASLFCSSYEE
jgi:hypothetical protein